ncbi:uncharacterized protein N0V89_006990 [Didymosphaeria variabile]|uniref:Uncharacterized protein n=1 Tax=Didymosphaeria variabile TaxID=1932322 RepID=A0A9W8XIT6_9PLEO|nr:uncharacterized protein N0V89_006990 [Didymosphaeria variabile]KAJ4351647.1 hypothetical protein N0V89_006990 [Didymosphaeria variabile]
MGPPMAYVGEGPGPQKSFSVYLSEQNASSAEHEAYLVVSGRNMAVAWWESPAIRSQEPKPLRGKTGAGAIGKKPARAKGSPMMRDLIRSSRANFAMLEAEHKKWEINFRTDKAYRNKHNLHDDILIEESCWETPFFGFLARMCREQTREAQLTMKFKSRWHTMRPLPTRSSLWKVDSVDDFEVTKESRRLEEAERLERQARKAASEVGWLYYVGGGGSDLLEEWRRAFLRSNHILVKGKWVLPPSLHGACADRAMAESTTVYSIEPAESFDADKILESVDENKGSAYELLEQYLDTAMLDDEPATK